MIDEALDPSTHDTVLVDFDEQTVEGIAQVLQNIKIRLLMVMGELFDNTRVGVDYFGVIFQTKDPAVIDALLKSTIRSTPEVTDVVSYVSTVTPQSRLIVVSFKVQTIYGTASVSNMELTNG
jgi:hypothetical protein